MVGREYRGKQFFREQSNSMSHIEIVEIRRRPRAAQVLRAQANHGARKMKALAVIIRQLRAIESRANRLPLLPVCGREELQPLVIDDGAQMAALPARDRDLAVRQLVELAIVREDNAQDFSQPFIMRDSQIVMGLGVIPTDQPGHLREMRGLKFDASLRRAPAILQAPGNEALFKK